jgi:hypothetical protein
MGPFAEELVAGPASANTARVCCGYAPRTRSLPPSNMVELPLGFGISSRDYFRERAVNLWVFVGEHPRLTLVRGLRQGPLSLRSMGAAASCF